MGWLLVNKEKYYAMKKDLELLKTDSPEGIIERAMNIMRLAGKDAEDDADYKDIMKRLYLFQLSRLDKNMKGYSETQFLKDNSEQIIDRLKETKMGFISKQNLLPNKSKKRNYKDEE